MNESKVKKPLKRVKKTALLLSILGIALITTGAVLNALFPLPLPNATQDFARIVTDKNGEPLRVFADSQGVWRYPVTLEEVSPRYIEALLNYEDQYFYEHLGINPLAMLRALGQWIYHGEIVSGGSTITMQVARILDPHPRTLAGKCQQIFRALQLESQFDKNEILELYLNYAPFGGPLEGVQAASFTYFGKPARELTHAEAALLAVLPQSPTRFRPDRHPERAERARNKVLARLEEFQVWPSTDIEAALLEPVIARFNSYPKIAPLLARRLINEYPTEQHIRTTIDSHLQRNIERTVKSYIQPFPAGTSAAVLIIDNATGNVLAYSGSADFEDDARFGHVDMITATRSPGSTLKPFLYGLAMDQGLIHEQSLLLDVPSSFNGYQPDNFDQGFSGPVSVRNALQQSLNVPAVQVLDALGANRFYAHLRSAGMALSASNNTLAEHNAANLSLILGGAGTSLESLVHIYAALGRGGLTKPLNFIHKPEGSSEGAPLTETELSETRRRLLSNEAAWIISDILAAAPLNTFDSHQPIATTHKKIAFKTGTSFGYRDAWVIAASQQLTISVWVGRPDGTPLADNVGRHTAVPLLRRLLAQLPDSQLQRPEKPAAVTRHTICWPLGTLKVLQDEAWCMREKGAWLIDEQAPANTLPDPLDSFWAGSLITVQLDKDNLQTNAQCLSPATHTQTIAVWPSSLDLWLPHKWRRQQLLPPWNPACKTATALSNLKIEGIEPGATLRPQFGGGQLPSIRLTTAQGGEVHWFLDGRWVQSGRELVVDDLVMGRHVVSVMGLGGQVDEVLFSVQR